MANQPKKYQKFVATAATATLVATAVVPAASADAKFSDIGSYATEVQEEVLFLADLGVISGFEDGTFKPAQNITRGQAVKMIGRFLVEQDITEVPENWETVQSFDDIALDRTDRDLVKYAAVVKAAGVFQGNGNVLNPSGFTTRENMALILDRLVGKVTGKTAVQWAEGKENNVTDLANAKEEAREAIAALNALGVSNAEEFKPKNNTQRVHFASFLARMIELADAQVTKVDSAKALNANTIEVTFKTGEETETVTYTLETPLVEGTNNLKVTHNGQEYDVVVTYSTEAAVEGQVTSSATINASEIKIEFNKAASFAKDADGDIDLAKLVEVIDIEKNGVALLADDLQNAQLSKDGKTLTISVKAAFKAGDKVAVQTSNKIQAVDGTFFKEYASETATFNAEAAPTFVSAEVKGKELFVTFDRPVNTKNHQMKINGSEVGFTAVATTQNEAGDYTYKVATGLVDTFLTNGTHEVVLYAVTSTGGTEAPVLFGNYTITSDVVTPAVTGITPIGTNTFFLTTNTSDITLDPKGLVVKQGNIVFKNEDDFTTGSGVKEEAGTTIVSAEVGKYNNQDGIYVVVSYDKNDKNGLYQGDATTATLSVELTNYKNTQGLIGQKYTGTVTLNQADNKPKVEKTDLVKTEDGTNKGLATIKFEQELVKDASFDASKIIVRDKDGVIQTVTPALDEATGVISFNVSDVTKAPFTVEVPAGQFKNVVTAGTATAGTATDTTKLAINKYTVYATANDKLTVSVGLGSDEVSPYTVYNPIVVKDDVAGVLEITYPADMSTTALQAANYTLDGKALPTGTTLDFVGDKKTVRITLPTETFATTAEQLLTISTNVKTANGSTIVKDLVSKTAAYGLVDITDNVKPVLKSGLYIVDEKVTTETKSNVVELTFSEAIKTIATTDLEFTINGATIAVDAVAVDAKDAKLVYVTLGQEVNVNQAATVTIAKDANVTDVADNKATVGTTATVSGTEFLATP